MPSKTGKAESRAAVKLTVPVAAELDLRLYGLAKSLGCGKAELAGRLLEMGCRRYQADRGLRAVAAEIGWGEGEVDRGQAGAG